jgi:hypothetical protein
MARMTLGRGDHPKGSMIAADPREMARNSKKSGD